MASRPPRRPGPRRAAGLLLAVVGLAGAAWAAGIPGPRRPSPPAASAADPATGPGLYLPWADRYGRAAPVTGLPPRTATTPARTPPGPTPTEAPTRTATEPPTRATHTPSAEPPTPAAGAIVVDHRSLELFDRIPERYLQGAALLRHLFIDKSVGANINDYLGCLTYPSMAEAPSRCRRVDHPAPEYAVDPLLLAWARPGGYDRSRWQYLGWQGNCGSWVDLVGCFTAMVEPVLAQWDVVSFQFSYLEVMPGSTIAGDQGFFSDNPRAGDVHDLEAWEARHPDKTVVYWTSSLARGIGSPESERFNARMREHARAHAKPLFDVADILSHDPAGRPCFDNRDGRPYGNENHPDDGQALAAICPHYTTETEGGHLGSVSAGGIRAAKGFWVLMARLAGWDEG